MLNGSKPKIEKPLMHVLNYNPISIVLSSFLRTCFFKNDLRMVCLILVFENKQSVV